MGFQSSREIAQSRASSVVDMAGLIVERGRLGSTAGQSVTKRTITTVPAIHRAWDFAASWVANLTMSVWRGEGVIPERVTATPQARLFGGVPNPLQNWWWFWYVTAMSLEARNNAYNWKTKDKNGQVVEVTALHPDQVVPTPTASGLRYDVWFDGSVPQPRDVKGLGTVTVDRGTILHYRGAGGMGELVPDTPIQRFKQTLGIALAKQDYEANLYQHGVMGGLGVTFPAATTAEQAKKWREVFDSEHAGTFNAGRTKVVGGGATLSQIGMSQKDAQFAEALDLTMRQIQQITGVPDWVLGIGAGPRMALTPEQRDAEWTHYGGETRLERIESALYADPDIFGPGSRDYPRFDTANAIHPDSRTADNIAHQQIQDGRLLVDEWRVPRGMPPLPNGVGMIPQVTPVGGAPNPGIPADKPAGQDADEPDADDEGGDDA